MLVVATVLSAACLGVLLGSSRVPRTRALPLAGSLILAVLLAVGLFTLDPANLPLALVFVVISAVASALYSASLWIRELPESPYGFAWFAVNGLFRPGQVRQHWATIVELRKGEPVLTQGS